jgi:adenosine deaminase
VNSDDPGMMRFDVADEYAAVAAAYGYSLEDMEAISLAGIDACWAPDDEKQAMRTRFGDEFDELRQAYDLPVRAAS